MQNAVLDNNINTIKNIMGPNSTVIVKKFNIGKNDPVKAAIIYINALVVKDLIDRDILSPLMLHVQESLKDKQDLLTYIGENYVPVCQTEIVIDISKAIDAIKRGKTLLIVEGSSSFLVADTTGGEYRAVEEPQNESVIRGSRDGFVENLETNISILRRKVRDKNLVIEVMKIGQRTQSDLALVYIKDIADEAMIKEVKDKLAAIEVDMVPATGVLEQFLDRYDYNIFPQFRGTERPDRTIANILEGRVAIVLEGTPYVITVPGVFMEFFQTPEDYYQRSIPASFLRLLRFFAALVTVTLDALYLALVSGNNEFLPLKFVIPIAKARQGVALSVFAGVLTMEVIVEFLREGGLRLPSKIAQTLSVVGGIIIGDAAVQSKIVSSSSLFVVGITTVSTFLIPSYDMSFAIRTLRFPMILLANILGLFGIAMGWFFIIAYLCTLENFSVPYFTFKKGDAKDSLIRRALWDMQKRPEVIPNKNPVRETDFRKQIKEDNNNEE